MQLIVKDSFENNDVGCQLLERVQKKNRELVLLKHLRRLDNISEKAVPWYTDRQIGRVNMLLLEIESPFSVTKSISPGSIFLHSGDYFVFFYINGYCLLLVVYPVFTPLLLLSVDLYLMASGKRWHFPQLRSGHNISLNQSGQSDSPHCGDWLR